MDTKRESGAVVNLMVERIGGGGGIELESVPLAILKLTGKQEVGSLGMAAFAKRKQSGTCSMAYGKPVTARVRIANEKELVARLGLALERYLPGKRKVLERAVIGRFLTTQVSTETLREIVADVSQGWVRK